VYNVKKNYGTKRGVGTISVFPTMEVEYTSRMVAVMMRTPEYTRYLLLSILCLSVNTDFCNSTEKRIFYSKLKSDAKFENHQKKLTYRDSAHNNDLLDQ